MTTTEQDDGYSVNLAWDISRYIDVKLSGSTTAL